MADGASGDGLIGRDLGGFRIERQIGQGGMSLVFLAHESALGDRPVALKVLSRELGDDPAFRVRFVREAQMAAAVDHPNLVPIYRAGIAEDRPFIAMRLVPGTDLHVLIQRGPLPPDRLLALFGQVAAALDTAHGAGLVHRDVKPRNILVTPGEPDHSYLTDFGIAKPVAGHPTLTGPGQLLGTPAYFAPEQVGGGPVDRRADVYALGCVLYECLVGHPPFPREDALAVVHAHITEPPPRPSVQRPGLPPALDEVVATALAKRPDDRYPTATALVRDVRRALHGRPAPREAGPPPAAVRRTPPPASVAHSAPATPTVTSVRPPSRVARPLVLLLVLWLAVTALRLAAEVATRPRPGLDVSQGPVFALVGVVFVLWLRHVYGNLEHLGARGLRYGHAWTVWGWVTPVLALWRPKQLVDDVWRASDPDLPADAGEQWRYAVLPARLSLWWVSYLATVLLLGPWNELLGLLAGLWTLGTLPLLFATVDLPRGLLVAGQVCGLASAGLAIAVVLAVSRRQTARARRLGARW